MKAILSIQKLEVEQMVEGEHQGLIDLITAKEILEKVKNKGKNRKNKAMLKKIQSKFIFKGFLYCPFCVSSGMLEKLQTGKGKHIDTTTVTTHIAHIEKKYK